MSMSGLLTVTASVFKISYGKIDKQTHKPYHVTAVLRDKN